MKNYSALLLCLLWLSSCTTTPQSNTKEDELSSDKQNTSSALSKFPSKFSGTIGCSNCDSLAIEVDIKSELQSFLLTKRYMGYGSDKKDSVCYNSGKWEIDGANELRLFNDVPDPEFTRFKIISADQLILLDSTGSEITNGNNYTLNIIKDVLNP